MMGRIMILKIMKLRMILRRRKINILILRRIRKKTIILRRKKIRIRIKIKFSWEFSLKNLGHDVFKKLYCLRDIFGQQKNNFYFLRKSCCLTVSYSLRNLFLGFF